MANIVEVNGVQYSQNEQPERKRGMSSKMMAILAMEMAMGAYMGMGGGYTRKRPNVDIVEEYGLIQQKKSKLSKNDRDWVVYTFERNYTKCV